VPKAEVDRGRGTERAIWEKGRRLVAERDLVNGGNGGLLSRHRAKGSMELLKKNIKSDRGGGPRVKQLGQKRKKKPHVRSGGGRNLDIC